MARRSTSMEGTDGVPDFLSQAEANPAWSNPAGFDFFHEGESSDPDRRRVAHHDNEDNNPHLDLNSQASKYEATNFPHIETYQELLVSSSVQRGGTNWRPPRQSSSSGGRGGRSASAIGAGRGVAATSGGRGATASAGGRGQPSYGAALSTGRGATRSSVGRGSRGGRGTVPRGVGRGSTTTSAARAAATSNGGLAAPIEPNVGMDEEDDSMGMGEDTMMNECSDDTDKALWTAENTNIFCELCVDEIRAGNTNNGHMTGRGYKNLCIKYFGATGLRHSNKQLKNRWNQLKALYGFWMFLNSHTGLGRHNGTVEAEDKFWTDHTEKKPLEWKNLRYGPPNNLDQLAEMFHGVAVDGSTSCIPGQYIGAEQEGQDGQQGEDGSPMSTSSRKRATSTTSSATSPSKKTKSPMVSIMKGMLELQKCDSESTQKVMQGEVMAQSMKKALDLVKESGAPQNSVEYFMATQLFVKAEHREVCFNFETPEDRLLWLKRWCRLKNMY